MTAETAKKFNDVVQLIDAAVHPSKMTKKEAREFLQEIATHVNNVDLAIQDEEPG